YRTIPYTHHLMRSMFLADIEELLYAMLKKNNAIGYPGFDYSMFVRGVQGRRLLKPVFKHHDAKGQTDAAAVAEEAELRVDLAKEQILVRMHRGVAWTRPDTHAYCEDRDWSVPLPEDLLKNKYRRARDLTWEEMYEELDRLQERKEALRREIDETTEKIEARRGRDDLPLHPPHPMHKAPQ